MLRLVPAASLEDRIAHMEHILANATATFGVDSAAVEEIQTLLTAARAEQARQNAPIDDPARDDDSTPG